MTSRPGADLVGRTAESRLLDALSAGRDGGCPGLLLRGGPGVGKTALLDAAAARAVDAGTRVLRSSAVEFEAGMTYSALHQLLYPLRRYAERLAGHHRDVVDRIFGLAPGPSPDPLAAGTAVLALLGEVAVERPVLMVADDVPWIDRASATALGFVVRRISDQPIVFLAAARTGADSFCDQLDLPVREIEPLAEPEAVELLDARWPELGPSVRLRMLAEAAGNPLALRELPKELSVRQRSGHLPLPALLPLSGRLETAFASAVGRLPAPTRTALLMAALDPGIGRAVIRRAAGEADGSDVLAPAREADLLQVDARVGRITFRHRLTRAAIVHLACPGERRRAHLALAAALTDVPERRAWHLAEATTGPDETLARALDEAALPAWRHGEPAAPDRRRGAASAAVAALVRAGELSPHPGDRSRRLVEAAYFATFTGQLDDVPRLLAEAGRAADPPTGLAFAATAQLLTHDEGDIDAAHRLLARALDDNAATTTDDEWDHSGILYALLLVSVHTHRPEPWRLLKTALDRFEPTEMTAIRLCYEAYVHPTTASDALRKGLADAFAALPADAAPWELIPLACAAVAMDALSDHRYLVSRMIERERDGGAIAMAVPALMLLCSDSYAHGRWDEAEGLAQEGLELAAAHGYRFWERQIRALLATGAAARGDGDLARTRSEETTTWAAPRGIEVTEAYAHSARHLAAMGQGDYEEAHVQVGRIDPSGAPSAGIPGRWLVLDLVEAAVRTGRTDEARAQVAAARTAGIHRISSRTALICAGAEAVAADEDDAGPLFEAALALPHAARWPWEHARIQLAYGQWLRRTRDHHARRHLSAALETFDRLGAKAMAQRARNELRATGVVTPSGPAAEAAALTVQERQIAELAAVGLTNRQIGERLFLSHRTVGSHLHRLYPKLGITSRAALRAALEAKPSGATARAAGPAVP
ncbi:AAA family ATPase [Streptomyces sp. NBC_00988]|uniref:AAA family ATPase n=1 Tax=Streptomyces sp. NBC_00988 TaxID=2903704 RepID=UPI0038633D24|nr:AAA family ATPase [Streptomyces sp. NBC_00988]